jgi:predicted type IV restriction endonuclease
MRFGKGATAQNEILNRGRNGEAVKRCLRHPSITAMGYDDETRREKRA